MVTWPRAESNCCNSECTARARAMMQRPRIARQGFEYQHLSTTRDPSVTSAGTSGFKRLEKANKYKCTYKALRVLELAVQRPAQGLRIPETQV